MKDTYSFFQKRHFPDFHKKTRCLASHSTPVVEEERFFNFCFDKGRIKLFVSWFLQKYGEKKTLKLLDELKLVGFAYATKAGASLGIEDLSVPPRKSELLAESEILVSSTKIQAQRGEITAVEKFQRMIDAWHQTSETLKTEVVKNFETTDLLNPVYMMAFSGARGNLSQVRQLVGMRGLMSDPTGQIIDYPIRSNFREGLTLTEYIISSYGARKGIVDTALRTANAGYLTRRLVDVAQQIIVSNFDCGTKRGLVVREMKEGNKTIYSLESRLLGRVLAADIIEEGKVLAKRNMEISASLASTLVKNQTKIFIRSPLTCETRKSVCQLCYGWTLGQGRLVPIGEAVGIIAAQSIGEPGTQLTMRTFHTGGVFSGDLTDEVLALEDGTITYSNSIAGSLIRTSQGKIAFLTKGEGELLFTGSTQIKKYKLPAFSILYARQNQTVFKKDLIAQISTGAYQTKQRDEAEQKIYSELEGSFYNGHVDLVEKFNEFDDPTFEADDWSFVWILSGKIYQHPLPISLYPRSGDLLSKKALTSSINWEMNHKGKLNFNMFPAPPNPFEAEKHLSENPLKLSFKMPFFDLPLKSMHYKNSSYLCKPETNSATLATSELDTFVLESGLENSKEQGLFLNSDEWRPQSTTFIHWFPKEHQISEAGFLHLDFLQSERIRQQNQNLVFDTENNSTWPLKVNKLLKLSMKDAKFQKSWVPNTETLKTRQPQLGQQKEASISYSLNHLQGTWTNLSKLSYESALGENSVTENLVTNSSPLFLKTTSWAPWLSLFSKQRKISKLHREDFTKLTPQGLVKSTKKSTLNQNLYILQKMKKADTLPFSFTQFACGSEYQGSASTQVFQTLLLSNLERAGTTLKKNSLFREKLEKKFFPSSKTGFPTQKNFPHVNLTKAYLAFLIKRSLTSTNDFSQPQLVIKFKKHELGLNSPKLSKNFIIKSQTDQINAASGWIYKTGVDSTVFHISQKKIEKGKAGFKDIIFDTHGIYIRPLIFEKSKNFVPSKMAFTENSGQEISWIQSKKSRFYFASSTFPMVIKQEETNSKRFGFFLLQKIHEKDYTLGFQVKQKLAKTYFENRETYEVGNSFEIFEKYHSIELNKQTCSNQLLSPTPEPENQPQLFFNLPNQEKQEIFLSPTVLNSETAGDNRNRMKKNWIIKKPFYFCFFPLSAEFSKRFQFQENPCKLEVSVEMKQSNFGLETRIFNKKNHQLDPTIVSKSQKRRLLGQVFQQKTAKSGPGSWETLSHAKFKQFSLSPCSFQGFPSLTVSKVEEPKYFLNYEKNAHSSKNTYLLYSNAHFFANSTFASTNFLSPFVGEVLKSEIYPFSNLIQKNRFLILRKNDLNTFSWQASSNSTVAFNSVYDVPETYIRYEGKVYRIKGLTGGLLDLNRKKRLGEFMLYGETLTENVGLPFSGQIIHCSQSKVTVRKGQPILLSPKAIFHQYSGDFVKKGQSIITLPYERLKTGDIVQGIPKVEQFFEARTTKAGKLFRDSIPNLLKGLFHHYRKRLPLEKAVRQSFYKIQQILVDGVQRVYRSQGVSIADKHIEVIVRQMTANVKILNGGQTGFFPGEIIDLDFVEDINRFLLRKITYEPLILGITRASLESDSFLAAASFQQTSKMLSRAALYSKRDFLRGLKENVIVGNLIPAGTGYLVHANDLATRFEKE